MVRDDTVSYRLIKCMLLAKEPKTRVSEGRREGEKKLYIYSNLITDIIILVFHIRYMTAKGV